MLFRIAKHKFFDTGEFKTIYKSFEALLNEHIFLLDTPDMWQEFRDKYLWNSGSNALIRQNIHHITKIANTYIYDDEEYWVQKVRGKSHMSMDDAIDFMTTHSKLDFSYKEAIYCYGMCKMTVIDEISSDERQ